MLLSLTQSKSEGRGCLRSIESIARLLGILSQSWPSEEVMLRPWLQQEVGPWRQCCMDFGAQLLGLLVK